VIIQTVKSKDNLDDEDWSRYHVSLREKNPEFDFLLFDDEEALEFVDEHFQDSALPEVMRNMPRSVMKADLFRLAAVAVLGGFYMDMDVIAKDSFDPIVSSGCGAVFPKEWWKDDQAYLDRHFKLPSDDEDHWQVGNYAFAAVPNHPLVVDSLDEAIKRSADSIAFFSESDAEMSDLDVLRTTGPYMISEVYHEGRKAGKYGDVSHIQGDMSKPLKDGQKYGYDWHKFGPFAEHMLSHTWVKESTNAEHDYLHPCPYYVYRGGCGSRWSPIDVYGCELRVEFCHDDTFYLGNVYSGEVIVDRLVNSFTNFRSSGFYTGSVLNITQGSAVQQVTFDVVDDSSKVEISSGSDVDKVTFGSNYGRIVAPGVPGSHMFGSFLSWGSCVVNRDGVRPNVWSNFGKVTTSEDQCDATADAMTSLFTSIF